MQRVLIACAACAGTSFASASITARDDAPSTELTDCSVAEYGISVQVPAAWKLVTKAQDALAFGYSIPSDNSPLAAGVKCEIASAPESLDEFRQRIDRRAAREKAFGVSLRANEVQQGEGGERLFTHWCFEPKDGPAVNDLEYRALAHDQLYIFTLRAPDAMLERLRPDFEKLVATAKFSAPNTGLEITKDGFCVQKKFRFGLKLPGGWRPSFPLSNESLFWATAKPKGIWNDNLLVIATKAQPIDLEALADQLPAKLREEDPNCTVKSCQRVAQGTIGDALETVVESQRGAFRITVLERRYTGRRYNYEIKFTVMSEVFENLAVELRKSADSFVEFIAPQDLKGNAT